MRTSSGALAGRLPRPAAAAAASLAFRFALDRVLCDVPWLSTAPSSQTDAEVTTGAVETPSHDQHDIKQCHHNNGLLTTGFKTYQQ